MHTKCTKDLNWTAIYEKGLLLIDELPHVETLFSSSWGYIDDPHWYRKGRRRRLNRIRRGYYGVPTFSFCWTWILQRNRESYTPRGRGILYTPSFHWHCYLHTRYKDGEKTNKWKQTFGEETSNRSRKISLSAYSTPAPLSQAVLFFTSIQTLDPEVGYSKKTSSPRMYQRIHWKQIRYDHFFFPCPLSAYIPVQREIPLKLVLQIQDKWCAIVP